MRPCLIPLFSTRWWSCFGDIAHTTCSNLFHRYTFNQPKVVAYLHFLIAAYGSK
jgi:hypothetical protein